MRYSYKRALDILVEYGYDEGYEKIILNHNGISFMNKKEKSLNTPYSIYIEKGYTLELKTYLFLHELGHHELRKDWVKFKKKFPVTAYAEQKAFNNGPRKLLRRKSYAVASLEEEFLAWDEGAKLAKKLGIRINMERWIELKSKCLKSYINYYATH